MDTLLSLPVHCAWNPLGTGYWWIMMTSSNGNTFRVTGHLCHKGQWRGALISSLNCAWINGWVNNREAGDLRRYHAHYDVTMMFPAKGASKHKNGNNATVSSYSSLLVDTTSWSNGELWLTFVSTFNTRHGPIIHEIWSDILNNTIGLRETYFKSLIVKKMFIITMIISVLL